MKILFVCTGNTCRSPMAQGIAEKIFGDGYEINSAGLMAVPGSPASAYAIAVMEEQKIDLKNHKAKLVSKTLLDNADLILTMTENHKLVLNSETHNKTYTLGEYAGKNISVSDPFGGSLDEYRRCAAEIHNLITGIEQRLSNRRKSETSKLHVTEHPLVESKLTMLRDIRTGNKEFRELVQEIAALICYEATRDVPLTEVNIETPLCSMKARLTERKFAIIPILRAGLGMVDGIAGLLPTAKIGHIGIFRDPNSLSPVEYYCKLPPDCSEREILLLDPMIGTGGTAIAAINFLKENSAGRIKFLSLLASPEGVSRLTEAHPDIEIYTAALDERLDDHGYIVPGLGDAGDRLFGTK